MLTILLQHWIGWTLAVLVAVAWLCTWALCRAAARGDYMVCSLRQNLAGPHAVRRAGDVAAAERLLTPQRAEAATESSAVGFSADEGDISRSLDDGRLDHGELPFGWASHDALSTNEDPWAARNADKIAAGTSGRTEYEFVG